MKKKIIIPSIFVTLTISGIIASAFLAKRIKQPTFINTPKQLNQIRDNLDGYYAISCNIFMNELDSDPDYDGWIPIGTKEKPFTGTIDFRFFAVLNLRFSSSYIQKQFDDDKIEDVLVGFLGYSKGKLLNVDFINPYGHDFTKYNSNKRVVFGFGCAVNEGHIELNRVEYGSYSSPLKLSNIVFGSIVGINKNEVLYVKTINTILLQFYGESIIGGLIGVAEKKSINNYLYKGGYIDVSYKSTSQNNVNIGCIVGKSEGANISNSYVGSNNKDGYMYNIYYQRSTNEPSNFNMGGVVGIVTGDDEVTISNSYVHTHYNISDKSIKMNFSCLVGNSQNEKIIIKNNVIDSDLTIDYKDSVNSVLCNGSYNKKNFINNLYTETMLPSFEKMKIEPNDSKMKEISKITCEEMMFNTTSANNKWEKHPDYFIMLLKEKY